MRQVLSWILLLHMLHLPVPCPDLDGECRGVPIHSLSEAHAWHVMMLGVLPNDDIDRGPIRTDEKGQPTSSSDFPFGDLAIPTVSSGSISNSSLAAVVPSAWVHRLFVDLAAVGPANQIRDFRNISDSASAPEMRSRLCVWRI